MEKIYAYTVSKSALEILKNGGWFEEDYFSSFDCDKAEVVDDNASNWPTYYSGSEWNFYYNENNEPMVSVTCYVLRDETYKCIERISCGSVTQDDILDQFPELEK